MNSKFCLFLSLLAIATSLNADFDVISSNSFESTQVQEVFVDTIIPVGGSITSNGITVTSTSDIETTVSIASAINEYFEPITIVNLEGGNVTIEVVNLPKLLSSNQASSSAASGCPDYPDSNYPIGVCLNHWDRTIVDITICALPFGDLRCPTIGLTTAVIDSVNKARIYGDGTILEEDFPDTVFRQYSFYKDVHVSRLYSGNCTSTSTCGGNPVLFIHGYQPESFLARIYNNGGPKYWGKFSDRLIGDGYRPYEFKWLTNARFEDVAYDLKAAIEQIETDTGKSVHIVAHSFGGVLTRRMLQTSPLNQIASSIASVTTIGTPHNGVFDGKTDFKGITFPKGQAATTHDFELCNQVSCHLMGENVLGSIIASLLKVGVEPGDEAYFLASEESRNALPALNIQSLIGFGRNDGILNDNATGGDGLISGEGQRFYPALIYTTENVAKWDGTLFKYSEGMGDAEITEYFLGRDEVSDDDPYLEPHEPSVPRNFVGFIHSPGTAIGPDWGEFDEIESFVPPGDGFHDVYQRVLDWIGGPVIKLGELVNEQVITGELSTPDEKDTFSFTANAGETVRINAADIGGTDFRPRLILYGPDGSYIKNDSHTSVAELVHLATTSGTYTLVLDDTAVYYGGWSPPQYRLLFVRIPGANEGGELINEGVVTDTLDLGDIDTYTFTANVGETVRINAADIGGTDFRPRLILYGPDGSYIKNDSHTSVAELVHLATTSGTYTLVLDDTAVYYGGWSPPQYRLLFVRIPGANEGGELINEGVVTDTLDLGDIDTYTFTANVGETVRINAADIGGTDFRPRLILYGPDGSYIKNDSHTSVAELVHLATTSGTYTLVLDDTAVYYGGWSPPQYRLLFVRIPGANEGGELINEGVVTDTLDLGDIDTYTFTANVGETVRINAADIGGTDFRPRLILYGPDGSYIKNDSHTSVAELVHLATTSGTYTLVLDDTAVYYGGWSPPQYRLLFVRIPGANEGGELINEGVVTDTLDLGDIDTYTFTANVGETVRINAADIGGTDFRPRLFLYGPDGSYIKYADDASVAELVHLATTSGTYTLVLIDNGVYYGGWSPPQYSLSFVREGG